MMSKTLLNIYSIAIFVLFLSSLNPWFMWGIPASALTLVCLTISLFYVSQSKGLRFTLKSLIIFILFISSFLWSHKYQNVNGLINGLLLGCTFVCLMALNSDQKEFTLKKITKWFAIILAISLTFHIANSVLSISLPFRSVDFNEQYYYQNYYFFLKNQSFTDQIIPRFSAVFLEPGHLGMICSYLLFVQGYNLRKWYNAVIFASLLLSLSLAAYVLLMLGLLLHTTATSKHRFVIVGLTVAVFYGIGSFATSYNSGNNMINEMIVQRLMIEDGDLVGNNRTQEVFDDEYDRTIKNTESLFFGKEYDKDRLGGGNAGYKLFIYQYGLLGLLFITLLYFALASGYSRGIAVALLILYGASFLQRAYPLWSSWLIIFICGLPLMQFNNNNHE